jgi:copper chaperone
MKNVNFSVPGINCGHCVRTIQTKLSQMEGVRSVTADAASKNVSVQFDDPASESSIKAELSAINFPAAS